MLTGIINWIRRQLEIFKIKRFLIEENNKLHKLLNFKIEKVLPTIEELRQDKVYYVFIDTPEGIETFREYYLNFKYKMKWTIPNMIVGNILINELPEEKLQSLLRKVRANKIKG